MISPSFIARGSTARDTGVDSRSIVIALPFTRS